jgi:hypothetical protein
MNMSINGISTYITLSALYGQDLNSTNSSDPLLEVNSTEQSDMFSTLGTGNSSSLSDSVNFSQTADFFSKLKQLEQTDPDKYKEVVKKLGERLQSARGYEGQVFSDLSQQVADGADISDVITQSSASTDLYSATGTSASQIKQLVSNVLSELNKDA